MRMQFRRLRKASRRLTAGNRKRRLRREAVLFFAPACLASTLLLVAAQNAAVLAAAWNDPQSLLAKRSPGERDEGALYDTKPERLADAQEGPEGILPQERVLAMTRERPTLPLPAEAAPEELPPELADLGDFIPGAISPAAFTGPAAGFAAPGGGGPGGGSSGFAPAGPVVAAVDDTTPPVTVPGGEPTTPADIPSAGPTPPADVPSSSAVPEPETWATTILGLFVVAGAMRHQNRRKRNAALPLAGEAARVATVRSLAALALGLCLAAALFIGVGALRSAPQPPAAAPPAASGPRLTYPADRLPRLSLPGGRSETIRSVLNIERPMRYGDFVWNEDDVPPGPVWVRVDPKRQLLSVFRGGHEIGAAVILYGAGDKQSPTGAFPVLQKAADYRSRTYDADMPYMLRLTADGVAIHGAAVRRGAATHGCIGVPTAFARRLFAQMRLGDPVVILDTAAKS